MSNVRNYGAAGDGQTDDTAAIEHAVRDGDGVLEFPRGDYRISHTIDVDLARKGRIAWSGLGGVARLLMNGEGPAISLRGTHSGTADPADFRPEQWQRERMPAIDGLEIQGIHPAADGIRIEGVMQATLTRLLIREVRTAVHVTDRARNVLISHCHIYHNHGVGVHLDQVNLHQVIITGSHISYCRRGGIRVDNSEIRNLQITGNDIEYNNQRSFPSAGASAGADVEPTAEIFVDTGAGSVREGTICGNTLQSTYSPHGANIRFLGDHASGNHKAGMWTISGNLIGSQNTNIHLTSVQGITISGNYIYSGHHRNVLVEGSRNVLLGPNCLGHNPDYGTQELATGVRFVDCDNCNITGLLMEDAQSGKHTVPGVVPINRDALIELVRCQRFNISGTQVLNGTPYGIFLQDCSQTLLTGASIIDSRDPPQMKAAIVWKGSGRGNMIAASRLGRGTETDVAADPSAHVTLGQNLLDA